MRTFLRSLICVLLSAAFCTPSPRAGWVYIPGAGDLIQSGQWSCVPGVTAGAGSVTVAATTGYNTVINTSGPVLHPQGDFSVLAQLSATSSTGAFLTLVGTLSTGGEFWQGLKRLDVGLDNKNILTNYWTGTSQNPTSHSFALSQSSSGSITIEVARTAGQIVVFANNAEAGRFADPGLFASGNVYLGFNVAPQTMLTVKALAAAEPAGATATLSAPYLQVAKRSGSALRDIAGPAGFLMGGAVDPANFSEAGYTQTLGREFNLMVPENAMKFAETEPGAHQFSFCAPDQIVAFAQANGMAVRGHNLVWNIGLPDWLTTGNYSSQDAANILKEHINTVMGHYKGQLIAWDVVNEAIADNQPYGLKDSYWHTQLGENYVDMAFQWAHAADPGVKLFYNDYNGEGLGGKSDGIYNFVKGMLNRKIPVNGVGLQMHVDLNSAPSQADITSNLKRLGALGLEVHITEMDVRLPVNSSGKASASDLAAQAAVYKNVFEACQAVPRCTAFLTWGITDAHSWIPSTFPGFGASLLFDAQNQPKPAYSSLADALRSNSHTPVPSIAAVTNGASFAAGSIAPGEIATLFGKDLTSATGVNLTSGLPLPTQFLDVGVRINGSLAPLFAIDNVNGQQQINFQVPWEVANQSTAKVEVLHAGIVSQSVTVPVLHAQPGIINYSSNGNNFGVILHADYQLADSSHPVAPGETVLIYCTGLGAVHSPPANGAAASGQMTVASATVTIGGVAGHVAFSGLAPSFVGLNQVNVDVPQGVKSGNQPVILSIGSASSPAVQMPVR